MAQVYDTPYAPEPVQTTKAVTATSSQIATTRIGKTPRTGFMLIPTTANMNASYRLSDSPAVLNSGLTFVTNQPFGQSANTVEEAMKVVWQGAIQCVSSINGNVAVFEQFAP